MTDNTRQAVLIMCLPLIGTSLEYFFYLFLWRIKMQREQGIPFMAFMLATNYVPAGSIHRRTPFGRVLIYHNDKACFNPFENAKPF